VRGKPARAGWGAGRACYRLFRRGRGLRRKYAGTKTIFGSSAGLVPSANAKRSCPLKSMGMLLLGELFVETAQSRAGTEAYVGEPTEFAHGLDSGQAESLDSSTQPTPVKLRVVNSNGARLSERAALVARLVHVLALSGTCRAQELGNLSSWLRELLSPADSRWSVRVRRAYPELFGVSPLCRIRRRVQDPAHLPCHLGMNCGMRLTASCQSISLSAFQGTSPA
jgi:hypothetical protein